MKLFFTLLFTGFLGNIFVLAIRNGKNVKISDVPYLASIFENGRLTCGAAILSNFWILTAQHCVTRYRSKGRVENLEGLLKDLNSLSVRTGSSQYNDPKSFYHKSFHSVDSIVPYQSDENKYYDVALVKLKTRILFDPAFQDQIPIACAAKSTLKDNDTVTISGFGRLQNDDHPDLIQQMDVPVFHVYEDYFNTWDGIHHVDGGDSGSPVIYNGAVVGVVSRGFDKTSGKEGTDDHERVDIHAEWIKEVTRYQVQDKCV